MGHCLVKWWTTKAIKTEHPRPMYIFEALWAAFHICFISGAWASMSRKSGIGLAIEPGVGSISQALSCLQHNQASVSQIPMAA